MNVHQLPARTDNYIYLLRDDATATTLVIDPTDSTPVLNFCVEKEWSIDGILLTHHHPDHITGVPGIVAKFHAPVWGFSGDRHRLPPLTHELKDGDDFSIQSMHFQVKYTPGHTLGHICYFMPEQKYLFCGDTLFSMGCGRLFEGTPEMMLSNFRWMRTLSQDTQVFCSHEYTQVNTEFALSLEPHNEKLKAFYQSVLAKRAQNTPTVPFPLSQEIAMNPVLRWDDSALRTALGLEAAHDVEVFSTVRSRRNQW